MSQTGVGESEKAGLLDSIVIFLALEGWLDVLVVCRCYKLVVLKCVAISRALPWV